jgi:hypothetical protein
MECLHVVAAVAESATVTESIAVAELAAAPLSVVVPS